MAPKTVLSREDYVALQIREAFGPENRWFAGVNLGHPPTEEEALRHYCDQGGADHFSEIFIPEDANN